MMKRMLPYLGHIPVVIIIVVGMATDEKEDKVVRICNNFFPL